MNKLILLLFTTIFALFVMQTIMGVTAGFSIPTAALSLLIVEKGNIPSPYILEQQFELWVLKPWSWNSALKTEACYPFPALLLATLSIVTRIPVWLIVLLPISGIARILIIYVITSKLLSQKIKKNVLFMIFFGLYIIYTILSQYAIHTIGRGILGVTIVGFFLYTIILQAYTTFSGLKTAVLVILFNIMALFTYYTAVTVILSISFFAIVVFMRCGLINATFTTIISLIVSLVGVFYTYTYKIASTVIRHHNFTFNNILKHILDNIFGSLDLYKGEAYARYYVYFFDDPVYRSLYPFELILKILTIIIVLIFASLFITQLISGKILGTKAMHYLFAFLLIVSELGEIPYLLLLPTIPTRFILFYGGIIIICLIVRLYKSCFITCKYDYEHNIKKSLICIILIIFLQLLLSIASSFWLYKDLIYGYTYATPSSYRRAMLDGLFVACFHPIEEKLKILSDISYSSYIFLSLLRYNDSMAYFSKVHIGPFIDLLNNLVSVENFEEELKRRGANSVIIPIFKQIIGGDIWGRNAKPDDLIRVIIYGYNTHFNVIYSSFYSIYIYSNN